MATERIIPAPPARLSSMPEFAPTNLGQLTMAQKLHFSRAMGNAEPRQEIPFQITFRHLDSRDDVRGFVQGRIERLEALKTRAVGCEVVLSVPHRQNSSTPEYNVELRFHLPGHDIFICRNSDKDESNRDIFIALGDAFDMLERRVEDRMRERRGEVKTHIPPESEGRVLSIFDIDGYGFLQTFDGSEIYFDKNSIINGEFENLRVGQKVAFNEEMGIKGPQVTSMRIV